MLLEVLPSLQAEESMLLVQTFGIGSGSMEKDSQQKIIDSWKSAVGFKEIAAPDKRASGMKMMDFAKSMSKVTVKRG